MPSRGPAVLTCTSTAAAGRRCANGQGVLFGVQAMPEPDMGCQPGQLVALRLAEKMPADLGRRRPASFDSISCA